MKIAAMPVKNNFYGNKYLQFRHICAIVRKSIFSTKRFRNLYFYSKFQKIHALIPNNHCKSRRIWNGSPVSATYSFKRFTGQTKEDVK